MYQLELYSNFSAPSQYLEEKLILDTLPIDLKKPVNKEFHNQSVSKEF